MRRKINNTVERKLYAESLGRCMNPDCKEELFKERGDIIEKAHIIPYCDTEDNSYENLIVLCPNCHTDFDKNDAFNIENVKQWKQIRQNEFKSFFSKKYSTFEDLKKEVVPLLLRNQTIFENYFVDSQRGLWDSFEGEILSNNRKLKSILQHNTSLIQKHKVKSYSNLALVRKFILHIDEFETTRSTKERTRHILFPPEINSMFGIEPALIEDSFLPSVEAIESLIEALQYKREFEEIVLGIPDPFIKVRKEKTTERIYLNDIPRLRQLYYDNDCFRKANVRFQSLNYTLKVLRKRKLSFDFPNINNLKEITINGVKIVFVYEYCLSKVELFKLSPEKNSVILNLHNWNGEFCISTEAYELAKEMKVTLLTMEKFYGYIDEFSHKR